MAETYQGKAKKPTENKVTKCGDFAKISEVSISKLRKKITDIAKGEEKKWRKNNSDDKFSEKYEDAGDGENKKKPDFYTDYEKSIIQNLLKNYYRFTTSPFDYMKAFNGEDPWSATYISFVICKALEEVCLIKQTDDSYEAEDDSLLEIYKKTGFFPSYKHIAYIAFSIYNEKNNPENTLFEYENIDTAITLKNNKIKTSIEEGDLICMPRTDRNQEQIDSFEFENIPEIKKNISLSVKKIKSIFPKIQVISHTDIVIDKYIDKKNNIMRLETLGGNAHDSYLGREDTVGRKIWVFQFKKGKLESFLVEKYDETKKNWQDQEGVKFPRTTIKKLNAIKGVIRIQ